MTAVVRPLAEINQRATEILVREMGVVDALRFLGQYGGSGDYSKQRRAWLDDLSLTQISSEINAKRRKPRSKS
jgi:hypothetical protein